MILECLLGFCVFIFFLCRNINRMKGLPPGPTPWPLVGNLWQLPFDGVENTLLGWKKQYGSVFTLWMPFPTVVIGDHEVMKRTVIRHGEVYMGRPTVHFMKLLLGGQYGLLYERNDWVKSQRKFTLHTLRNLGMGHHAVIDTITQLAADMVEEIRNKEQPIDIRDSVTHCAGNVIHQLIFGSIRQRGDEEIQWFQNELALVLEHFTDPKLFILDLCPGVRYLDQILDMGLGKTLEANDKLLYFLRMKVKEHEKVLDVHSEPTNYIDSYLLEIYRRRQEGIDEEFSEHQLVVCLYDLYSAGFETIVSAIQFAFFYLLNDKESQKRIHEEIDTQIGAHKAVTIDDQRHLPFTCAFLQESSRLGYALPINFLRVTMEDTQCEEYHLPKGTRILPQVVTSQIDDSHYERPEYFCPMRHIKDGQFIKDERVNPFSVGKRACPGESLARSEVFMFFVSLLQHFRFEHVGLLPPGEILSGTIRAPRPYLMTAIERHPN